MLRSSQLDKHDNHDHNDSEPEMGRRLEVALSYESRQREISCQDLVYVVATI